MELFWYPWNEVTDPKTQQWNRSREMWKFGFSLCVYLRKRTVLNQTLNFYKDFPRTPDRKKLNLALAHFWEQLKAIRAYFLGWQMLYWPSWAASKLYGIFRIQKWGFTLFFRLRLWPVHYTPKKFKNRALFLQLGTSPTLIRHKNEAFPKSFVFFERKRSSITSRRNSKTPAFCFSVVVKKHTRFFKGLS